MERNEDYDNFVSRMGSFDDSLDGILPGVEKQISGANHLKHHGTKGMKWGIRKATNKQLGSASAASKAASKAAGEGKKINESIRGIRTTKASKVDLSNMDSKDLQAAVSRMNLEQQYAQLSTRQTSRGQEYASHALEIAGSVLAITGSALTIALSMKQLRG